MFGVIREVQLDANMATKAKEKYYRVEVTERRHTLMKHTHSHIPTLV